MTTTIYLVRHGEVHNPKHIIYGRLPGYRLSDAGRKQAEKLGVHLSKKNIRAIYASPLERTHETATYIQLHHGHLAIEHDERIIESYTPIEGRPVTLVENDNWNFYQEKYISIGGETLSDIWNRMNTFFREKVRTHGGQEIVVVSHGDPIMISASQATGKPLTLESIRGEGYIETANGYEIAFDGDKVSGIRKIQVSY